MMLRRTALKRKTELRRTPMPRGTRERAARSRSMMGHRRVDTGPTPAQRLVVVSRAGSACERCSEPWTGLQVHHRLPRGMGGSSLPEINSPANLLLLCPDCHGWVESNRTDAYTAGWLVHRGLDPAAVPVTVHGYGPVLLTDAGEYRDVAA